MIAEVTLRELGAPTPTELEQLVDLLVVVVDEGASVGFLPPLARGEAEAYWRAVPAPNVVLLVAEEPPGTILGTAQLHLATKPNATHRAEVAKVLVHPRARRRGIARRLMAQVEAVARAHSRTLLVLDTRAGDPSNDLYRSIGYRLAGEIPGYARNGSGTLDATCVYYKQLAEG